MSKILPKLRQASGKYLVTGILGILVIVAGVMAINNGKNRSKLVYADSLDTKVLTVEGRELTLRDLAFYVAYEEMTVQEQAIVYNEDYPNQYWNLHVDGEFVKIAARNAAIQMALHDELFYQMAMEEEIELSEQEKTALSNQTADFLDDLSDYDGLKSLGVTEEDIRCSLERIAYAQHYQAIYAALAGAEYEEYDFAKEEYQTFRDTCDYSIEENVWERVDFGNVILDNY